MYKLVRIYSLVLLSCHIYTITFASSALVKNNYIGISEEEADMFYKKENYEPALLKYEAILEEHLTIEKRSELIIKIGKCYEKLSEYGSALEYYQKFLDMPYSAEVPLKRAKILANAASIYRAVGNFERSYNYQLQALGTFETNQDSIGIARSLYKLGTLFFYQNNYEKALEHYLQSRAICQKLDNQEKSMFSCLGAIGSVFSATDRPEEALQYHFQALEIAKKRGMKSGEAYSLHNIGASYLVLEENNKARKYLQKSLEIKKELKDKWGQIGSYQYLGNLSIKLKESWEAIQFLNKGIILAKEVGAKPREADLYKVLSDAYKATGNNALAYTYLEKHTLLRDALINEKTVKELSIRKEQYEIQKREHEIESLKQVNAILERDNQLKVLQNKNLIILISLLASMFFALFLMYRYLSQRKWNKQLEEKNERIRLQNKRLSFNNQELKKFAFIASHDLKAPVRTIGSFTGLLKKKYYNSFDETAREYLDYIISGAKGMYQLLDDLLTYSNIDGLLDQSPEEIAKLEQWLDTKAVVDTALSNLAFNIEQERAEIIVNEPALPEVKANPSQLLQLFQNLIGNGIKFRKENRKPQISIDCASNGDQHIFSIKDNGIGIDPAYKDKIFEMFSRLHGVGVYEGTGIGLATCKKIINRLGGEIWVESEEGKGSTFFFSLPNYQNS